MRALHASRHAVRVTVIVLGAALGALAAACNHPPGEAPRDEIIVGPAVGAPAPNAAQSAASDSAALQPQGELHRPRRARR